MAETSKSHLELAIEFVNNHVPVLGYACTATEAFEKSKDYFAIDHIDGAIRHAHHQALVAALGFIEETFHVGRETVRRDRGSVGTGGEPGVQGPEAT